MLNETCAVARVVPFTNNTCKGQLYLLLQNIGLGVCWVHTEVLGYRSLPTVIRVWGPQPGEVCIG